ncbi:O-antigen ligase family protein [Intestinibaculum porci]|nr:O-antigen ligase family protein [Intestinibaculum porci]
MDYALLGFGVVVLISSLTSRFGMHAFTGDLTFKVGGFLLLAVIFMYFMISKIEAPLPIHYIWAAPVLFLEITAILNSLTIDPLHMALPQMTLSDRVYFISTIGHIDYLSEYFCLFIPFFVAMLIRSDKKKDQILYGIIVFLGYLSSLLVRANGMILGCVFGLFVIGIYCLSHSKYMKVYLLQYFLFVFAALITDLINHLYIIPYKQLELDALSSHLSNKLYLVIAVILGILLVIEHKASDDTLKKVYKVMQKVILTLFVIALCGWLIFSIYCVVNNLQLPIFNNRINIWRGSFISFQHMSIREKFFGVGPNCVSAMLDKYAVYQGVSRTTAHNELLEYFLSTGILGFVTYLSFWVLLIRSLIKNSYKPYALAYLAGLVGYAGISLVVGPSFLNTVTLFTLLALASKEALSEA